ncbi:MAG: hypothetical protein MZU95_11155 [Desulfomicrobium escambiense]|nr:hypothetical protein [Desulfomicrobium escambiense]
MGGTDESHIIRTIEYWDIERKRHREYDHIAVIVAEDITSRFLNVISLFSGAIPLIAIQMHALRSGKQVGLVFTTVLDQRPLGLPDEDEEARGTNRSLLLGIARLEEEQAATADQLLEIAKIHDPSLELKVQQILHWACQEWAALQLCLFFV